MTEEKRTKKQKNRDTEEVYARRRGRRSRLSPQERKKRRKQEVFLQWLVLGIIVFGAIILFFAYQYGRRRSQPVNLDQSQTEAVSTEADAEAEAILVPEPDIDVQLLTINEYSRPGIPTDPITAIVIHYLANPGTTAQQNRDYFENLKDTHLTKASSHFIIGLDGEIIQCIPLDEISYASNERNSDTISIECCHRKENGKFTKKTYKSLVKLTTWLCASYGIPSSDVIRHYDVTGKLCPLYFVRHEDAWTEFLSDIQKKLEKNG